MGVDPISCHLVINLISTTIVMYGQINIGGLMIDKNRRALIHGEYVKLDGDKDAYVGFIKDTQTNEQGLMIVDNPDPCRAGAPRGWSPSRRR